MRFNIRLFNENVKRSKTWLSVFNMLYYKQNKKWKKGNDFSNRVKDFFGMFGSSGSDTILVKPSLFL